MGNYQQQEINENELQPYLREGLSMRDLINLKKAFDSLDEDNDGFIEYDTKKITDINKYELRISEPNGKVKIDFPKFMQIMTDNIIRNRAAFGKDATSYESETSTVLCVICPFKHEE